MTAVAEREDYPYRDRCAQCAAELPHHHTGERTKAMPHEAGEYYCWCLDQQAPEDA